MKKIIAIVCVILSAGSQFSEAHTDKNKKAENDIVTAVSEFNENRFSSSAGILRKVITEVPENDAAHYYLAMSEYMQGNNDVAETEFKKAISLDSTNFWYRQRLAVFYSMTDRKELTIGIYERLLKDFPKKSNLYYSLVDLYLSQGQTEKALETIGQIETEFGKSDAVAMSRFELLRRLNRQREAYESLEAYNREYSSPQVLAILGDYQMSMYNDTTALKYYDEALDLSSDYVPALLGKAETYRVTRRYEDYFSVMNGFVRNAAISPQGKSDYLTALIQRSDPQFVQTFRPRIDSLINGCISTHERDSSILFLAGSYYYVTDRAEMAKGCFEKNRELYPKSLSIAAGYSELLMYQQDWEGLVEESLGSYEDFSEETAFLELAGAGYYNLGRYSDALDICERIIVAAKGDSLKTLTAYTTMGDMYHLLGEASKSYKAYDKALKVNPDYAPVLNNYAYYLSMEGKKLKKAYTMSRKTVEQEPDNPTYLDTFAWILYLQGKSLEAKPFFKHAMLYGGKDSAVILDHYAEVLYALGEYDLAFVYWNQAKSKNDDEIPDLDERIGRRRAEMKK